MPGKRLEGFVDNGRGEPAADLPAVATRLSDGVVVDTTITDANGHWLFTGLPTADEYVVELTDTAGNAVARAPWSGEMRELFVRDRLEVAGKPVLIDAAAGNALLWTVSGLYVPPIPAALDAYTKTESDARYPLKTDPDPYPTYLTAAEADALFLTPTEGNAAYATSAHNHDTTYVQLTGGSVMTGLLGPSTHNTRDLGTTGTRWRALYGMTGDLTTSLTVASKAVGVSATGGNTLTWNSDGFYVAAGAVTDIWVNTLGDTMTGDLLMTANVLPTVTNVRSLGSTSLRWLKVWATDADFTNAPTVGGSALLTATAADALFLTPAEGNAAYVALTGGSVMTGLLGPTTTNTRDLGTTALRWRKLWAVDAEFTNAPTVGGAALLTATAADALFLTPAEGNAAYATSAHNHDAAYVNVGGDTMTGPLLLPDGTLAAPSLGFSNDTNNGLRLSSSDAWRLVAGGVDIAQIGAGGLTVVTGLISTPSLIVSSGGASITGAVTMSSTLSVNSRPVIMAGCRVRRTTVQTLTTGVAAAIAFDAERYDTDAFHDNVTANTRLTVPAGLAGKYLITGCVEFVGHATGNRAVSIRVSGGIMNAVVQPAVNTNPPALTCTCVWDMGVGDYAELFAYQDSGGNLNVSVGANYTPEFSMTRIA